MGASKKVVLIGHFGVGKSSLVRRFVHAEFSDNYLTTIGVKVDKKVVLHEGQEVSLLIWDIAGESSVTKVPESYKLGSHGFIYVFDCTRPSTYQNIDSEIASLKEMSLDVPIVVVGNKTDLLNENEQDLLNAEVRFDEVLLTSAKSGDGVDEMFLNLTAKMLQ